MASQQRFNLYAQIHKGLRACMSEVLVSVGRLDPQDDDEVRTAAAAVRGLIDFARDHLAHEEQLIHPALEARRPGASVETHADHLHHLESFRLIEACLREVESSPAAVRADTVQRLYRQLALFVAANFEHMHVEETENHAALCASYSEEEILDLHRTVVASVRPPALMVALRWMIPSSSAPERAALLAGMQRDAPPPVFAAVLELIRPHLSARDWARLGAAIGPMPSSVDVPPNRLAHAGAALALAA